MGEWVDAIIFAVIAATVIRSLFIEAYQIPTSSMEKTLMVGDFLFVSKVNYGARLPMTPISFPFAHHTMPFTKDTKSYIEALKLPYYRLPGFQKIKNGDVVVFNWPAEREGRPVDKKENYIKRCVAIPGDVLEVREGMVYINGVAEHVPPKRQFEYEVKTSSYDLPKEFYEEQDITDRSPATGVPVHYMHLTDKARDAVKGLSEVISIDTNLHRRGEEGHGMLFPFSKQHDWSRDFYGPLTIPKKGVTVKLDSSNYFIYERLIQEYENHPSFEMRGNKFYMDDQEITDYTFEMNYYFMMGDNRHNSLDSRAWGFVPEDHIVGKAIFVAFSVKHEITHRPKRDASGNVVEYVETKKFKGIRWSRIFMGIE
ncbi:MAG: signal peptidase I [Bacteroidetes bacterium]|nr:signal peptidase I [Bacteroidota bacterium]